MKTGPAWRTHSINWLALAGSSPNSRKNLRNTKMKREKPQGPIPGTGSNQNGARRDGNFARCEMTSRPPSARSSMRRRKREREFSQSSVARSTKSEANSDNSHGGRKFRGKPAQIDQEKGCFMPNRSFQSPIKNARFHAVTTRLAEAPRRPPRGGPHNDPAA